MSMLKGTLSDAAAKRIGRSNLAGRQVEYVLRQESEAPPGKPMTKEVYYNGKRIAGVMTIEPDGIIPESDLGNNLERTAGNVLPDPTTKLQHALATYYNEHELHSLCSDLGVRYDFLPGEGKASKISELILYLERNERISELMENIKRARPHVTWEDEPKVIRETPATFQNDPSEPLFSDKHVSAQADSDRLSQLLDYCFSTEELQELCFDLGVDYESLGGAEKAQKAKGLVVYFLDPKRDIATLAQACTQLRPKAPWNKPDTIRYEPYHPGTLAEFSQMLRDHSDEMQFRSLCKSLGVDPEDLLGASQADRAEELVFYLARRERIDELVEICSQQYGEVSWRAVLG
jgi:hypothetical protein